MCDWALEPAVENEQGLLILSNRKLLFKEVITSAHTQVGHVCFVLNIKWEFLGL